MRAYSVAIVALLAGLSALASAQSTTPQAAPPPPPALPNAEPVNAADGREAVIVLAAHLLFLPEVNSPILEER